jgi:transcriptional regulator with XRE-family HTH domain
MDKDNQLGGIDAHIGGKIQVRRNLLKISQKKLGEQLGVSFQQIQKFEKGANRVSAGQLFEIAKFLQVDLVYFFDGLPLGKRQPGFAEAQAKIAAPAVADTREGHELHAAFARIKNPKLRNKIVDLVKAVADSGSK